MPRGKQQAKRVKLIRHNFQSPPVRQDGWPQASSDVPFIGAAMYGLNSIYQRIHIYHSVLLISLVALLFALPGCGTQKAPANASKTDAKQNKTTAQIVKEELPNAITGKGWH